MAEKRKRRPQRKDIKDKKDNRAAIAGIILVALVCVVVIVKYVGKTGTREVSAPGTAARGAGQAQDIAEGPQGSTAVAVKSAVIIPPNATSGTPLNIAYEANNPGGRPFTAAFRWYVDGTVVQEGPSNALQPGPYRKGSSVHADVTITDQNGVTNTLSTPPVAIAGVPPEITAVALGPENAVSGTVLSATPSGTAQVGDPIQYVYQWRVNGSPVGAPGNESTFSTSGLKKHDSVNVMVTYAESGAAKANPVVSNTIILQNRKPKITSTPPLELTGGGLYVYQVSANDPDGDPLVFRLDRFPSGMTIDASSGLIRWELSKGMMYIGKNEVSTSVTVNDGDGGDDSQDFTIIITDVMVN